jgi:type I restriction enzyme, S subunit
MRLGWSMEPFDCVISDQSAGNVKTLQSNFLSAGRFPVVDQGKDLIAGYVNDASRLCRAGLPVIIFGDHTRCIKFVDFPFCIGADGVKVLRPRENADVKYIYHYLRQLPLSEAGYARHYKYLKCCSVLVPPLLEQRRIAAVLDKADTLRAKRRAALAQLDALTQSIFLDMFGDPARNLRRLPNLPLNSIAEIMTGGTPSRTIAGYFGGDIPWVKTAEIIGDEISATEERLTAPGLRAIRGRLHPPKSIVIAMYGQGKTRGHSALLAIEAAVNQACAVIRPNPKFDSRFMFEQMKLCYERLRSLGRGGNQENLNLDLVGSFHVLLPPLARQAAFSERIKTLEGVRSLCRNSLVALDALFTSLQYRAFRGEL